MNLVIIKQTPCRVPGKFLKSQLGQMFKLLQKQKVKNVTLLNKDLVLVFVDQSQQAALNQQFRNKHRPTDVLSFDSTDPDAIGELTLCCEVIERQATENGWAYRWELLYMVLHGTLHLLGYEHEQDPKKAREMFSLQDRIFAEVTGFEIGREL